MSPSSTSPLGTFPPARGRSRIGADGPRRTRLLLLVPAVALAFITGELVYLGVANYSPGTSRSEVLSNLLFSIAVLAWNGLVPAALAGLVLVSARFWPLGLPVVVGTCVLFTVVIVGSLISMNVDESSTAVLLLLFLPLYLLLALLPFVGLTALTHRLRRRAAQAKDVDRTR